MTACHCPEAMLFHGPLVSHPQESCRTVNKERASSAPTLGLRQAAQERPCLIVPYALHHQLKATKPQAYFALMA